MNDITIFIFGICFAATVGATFAFMWRSMSVVFKEMDKYVDRPVRKPVHPEMKDVQSGDTLLIFKGIEKFVSLFTFELLERFIFNFNLFLNI